VPLGGADSSAMVSDCGLPDSAVDRGPHDGNRRKEAKDAGKLSERSGDGRGPIVENAETGVVDDGR
jgi:hypothetical protein